MARPEIVASLTDSVSMSSGGANKKGGITSVSTASLTGISTFNQRNKWVRDKSSSLVVDATRYLLTFLTGYYVGKVSYKNYRTTHILQVDLVQYIGQKSPMMATLACMLRCSDHSHGVEYCNAALEFSKVYPFTLCSRINGCLRITPHSIDGRICTPMQGSSFGKSRALTRNLQKVFFTTCEAAIIIIIIRRWTGYTTNCSTRFTTRGR